MKLTPEQVIELENETIKICQELIQIPSVNYGEGRGDEKAAAEYIVEKLSEVGIKSELIESAPNRVNVVASIEGRDQNRPGLVLHGHIDVVPANAEDWSVDPFGGVIKDGYLWGRGAVDMKDMDAMILAVVRMWSRGKYKPPRNILLVFFADEEAGSTYGSRWLVKHRPELFKGYSEAISEVGGFSINITGDRRIYLIEAAQKGIQWIKLTAKGTAGHGSFFNQVRKIAEITGDNYNAADVKPLIKHLGNAARMISATISNTANPTMLNAGYKENVIPQSASAVVDGRFLPGYEDQLHQTIRKLAGDEIEVEILVRDIALEVDFAGPLVEAMCNAISAEDPDGIPVPYLMSGGTDNKALHDLGIVGYGFSPLRLPKDLDFFSLFHGVDERVPLESLKFGARVLYDFLDHV